MRFYLRKRRQAPAVIIVALIDILIVLLIFLMVTTTFRQQPALKIALPDSSHAQKSGASEKLALMLVVDSTGGYRLGPEAKPVTLDRCKSELFQAVAKNPNAELIVNADKNSPFGQVLKVLDIAKDAGMTTRIMANKEEPK